jgi:hypothetical protein
VKIVAAPGDSIRVVILGDPQYETTRQPEVLSSQISTLLSDPPDLVIGNGDCTDDGLAASWSWFSTQMARLTVANIPWIITTGNHDYYDYSTTKNRAFVGNTYVSPGPWITGLYQAGHIENSYAIVTFGSVRYLILSLEWSPRDAVVTWANSIMAANPGIRAILVTHAYMGIDGLRLDWATYGLLQPGNPHNPAAATTPAEGINDGQQLWDQLVKNYPFDLVISGHVAPCYSWRSDNRLDGLACVQLGVDWQYNGSWGGGYMLDIDLDLANKQITTSTLGSYLKSEKTENQLIFKSPLA